MRCAIPCSVRPAVTRLCGRQSVVAVPLKPGWHIHPREPLDEMHSFIIVHPHRISSALKIADKLIAHCICMVVILVSIPIQAAFDIGVTTSGMKIGTRATHVESVEKAV